MVVIVPSQFVSLMVTGVATAHQHPILSNDVFVIVNLAHSPASVSWKTSRANTVEFASLHSNALLLLLFAELLLLTELLLTELLLLFAELLLLTELLLLSELLLTELLLATELLLLSELLLTLK